jgi:peptide/nickel transport system permease protein
MTSYILRRILYIFPLMLLMTAITFTMIELAPGEFVDALVPPDTAFGIRLDPETRDLLKKRYGFDKPPAVRYFIWVKELVLHQNLGTDLVTGRPVLEELTKRWPMSLRLQFIALVVHVCLGTILGMTCAFRQYSWLDHLLTGFSLIWISTPLFVFAIFLLYLFALVWPIFPVGHEKPVGVQDPTIWQTMHHMALPVIVLSLSGVAGTQRLMRATILEVLNSDYVRTARAKGLSDRVIRYRHVLRNASLPLVTGLVLGLPGLLGGSFIVEYVFSWPGVGSYSLEAALHYNYPVLLGGLILNGGLVLFTSLLADIAIGWVDPRIRLTRRASA